MVDFCFCGTVAIARDLCRRHYLAAYKKGLPPLTASKVSKPLKERLLAKVEKVESGCWMFRGNLDKNGYGVIWVDRKKAFAHRMAFSVFCEPIQKGDVICHKCDVPACINPAHLFKGTRLDNNRDKVAKGRQFRGGTHPRSKLTEDDVGRILSMRHMTGKAVAGIFGVNQSTIARIWSGDRWKHRSIGY